MSEVVYCDWCCVNHLENEHLSKQRRWEKRNIEKTRAGNRVRNKRYRAAHAAIRVS